MKQWAGKILTGCNGNELLQKLINEANAQCIHRANEATGLKFKCYSPWMSHAFKRSEWSYLHHDFTEPTLPSDERLIALSLAFDDDGPLRAIDPSNLDRQICFDQPLVIDEFRSRVSGYLKIVQNLGSDYSGRLNALVQEIIPLRKIKADAPIRFDGEGMTTQCYRGGIFLTLAKKSERHECENLLNFVHELGHQSFNLLLTSDSVVAGNIYSPAYSPVRKTMRPGILAFHALVAVAYMVELMARAPNIFLSTSDSRWVRQRYLKLMRDLEYGLASVRTLSLTEVGKEVVQEFEALFSFAQVGSRDYKYN